MIKMEEKEKITFTDAKTLANYINFFYKKHINPTGNLSDIVLQKSLYFLFAYWGGFIRQGILDKNQEIEGQPEYLYNDKIEAWTYGPVLPEIYKLRKQEKLFVDDDGVENIFGENTFMKSIIDGLLSDILKVDPFRLVTISHMDKCWRDNYKVDDAKHDREILKEAILEEYGNKVKI